MQTVLIVIHLMIVLALVAVVLVQRSEGGGLGIGGGGGNMMASRSSGNALTRITGILALAFFVTSLTLGILARYEQGPSSILDRIEGQTEGTGQGILDQLGGPAPQTQTAPDGASDIPSLPSSDPAPQTQAPATDAPATDAPAAVDDAPAATDAAPAAPAASDAPAAEDAPAPNTVPTGQ
ncbi:preprotein translocase subunit SecG [Georhizobium sp. MAB10]|jgi:preprotein translocase subunit SecG|uniref:preprotein translocase subunit SecG n=1 Tax=Georhizobium sp. MAB10 TaxID=3028319 RepID=UPI003855E863